MFAAGAPQLYVLVNVAALVIGVFASALIRRVPVSTIAIGLVLMLTAIFGVHLEGASRWIRVAGLSLQPSLILLPLAMMQFARHRTWLSSIGIVIASIGLTMQPDRAMAGTLLAGVVALWMHRREMPVTVALIAATVGFASTVVRVDAVAPVLFVEQVVQSAFAFHVLTGLAIVVGLVATLMPAALGPRSTTKDREIFAVFGVTWLVMIAFAIVGNYPTPLVGYGSSAILGYCFSAALLSDTGASWKPSFRTRAMPSATSVGRPASR